MFNSAYQINDDHILHKIFRFISFLLIYSYCDIKLPNHYQMLLNKKLLNFAMNISFLLELWFLHFFLNLYLSGIANGQSHLAFSGLSPPGAQKTLSPYFLIFCIF